MKTLKEDVELFWGYLYPFCNTFFTFFTLFSIFISGATKTRQPSSRVFFRLLGDTKNCFYHFHPDLGANTGRLGKKPMFYQLLHMNLIANSIENVPYMLLKANYRNEKIVHSVCIIWYDFSVIPPSIFLIDQIACYYG